MGWWAMVPTILVRNNSCYHSDWISPSSQIIWALKLNASLEILPSTTNFCHRYSEWTGSVPANLRILPMQSIITNPAPALPCLDPIQVDLREILLRGMPGNKNGRWECRGTLALQGSPMNRWWRYISGGRQLFFRSRNCMWNHYLVGSSRTSLKLCLS